MATDEERSGPGRGTSAGAGTGSTGEGATGTGSTGLQAQSRANLPSTIRVVETDAKVSTVRAALVGWVFVAVLSAVTLAGIVLARPGTAFEGFVWRHFLGPLHAEAQGADCAYLAGGVSTVGDVAACNAAITAGQPFVTAGYTPVALVGYGLAFAFLLVGALLVLHVRGLFDGTRLFYAAVPFMVFAGAFLGLREVVAALPGGAVEAVGFPASLLFVDPIPHFLVLAVSAVAFVLVDAAGRLGYVEGFRRPAAAVAGLAVVPVVGALVTLALARPDVGVSVSGPLAAVGAATVAAALVWAAVGRVRPSLVADVGALGLVLLWGYTLNGVTTVVAAEWTNALGLPTRVPPNGVARTIGMLSDVVLPGGVVATLGLLWPFVLVQVAIALVVADTLDEGSVGDTPLILATLVAVLAVALVPAVRTLVVVAFPV